MAKLTVKMKNDQQNRLNVVVLRVRHALSEAVANDEITKIETLLVLDCVKSEITKSVYTKSKLPAPSDDSENSEGVRSYQKTNEDSMRDNSIN